MDSITQATLGAAVAEAGMGKSLGRKAALWGLLLGTLPDLDILIYPLLDPAAQLGWHRGLSHSLLAMLVMSPLCGWLLHKKYQDKAPPVRASWTCFWIFLTHVLIDCFTVYGTQIFEPFSDMRIGFNNFFIIDPLFTLPILVGVVAAVILYQNPVWRFRANTLGLVISSIYVMWSFSAKAIITSRFSNELERQGIEITRQMTHPTAFNTLLWRSLSEAENGYWVGYASLLDRTPEVAFKFIPRQAELISPLYDTRSVDRLLWFSEGYFMAAKRKGQLTFSDLRFGEFQLADGNITTFFTWVLEPTAEDVKIQQIRADRPDGTLKQIWNRMLAKEPPIASKTD
ncbi:MAG: metal-dependent hydrolase [Verrucomicrobiota bacterium]